MIVDEHCESCTRPAWEKRESSVFSAVFRNDHNCLGNLLVRRAEGSRDAAGGGADRHAGVVIAGLGRNRALREIFSVDGRSARVTAADAGNRKLAGLRQYFSSFNAVRNRKSGVA